MPKKKSITITPAILVLAVLLIPQLVAAQRWIGPSSNPPDGLSPSFLNGSSVIQRKLGSLLIGPQIIDDQPVPSSLCLNPSTNDATDPDACITSWTNTLSTGGPFVRKLSGTQVASDLDSGYATFKGDVDRNQFYSLIAEADSTTTGAAAVYGASPDSAKYAGNFVGKVAVGGSTAQLLCLNDKDGGAGSCITSWADASSTGGAAIVHLQQTSTIAADMGNISLSGTFLSVDSGDASNGAIVIGEPTNDVPISVTCGDGLCSAINNEPGQCALDCF